MQFILTIVVSVANCTNIGKNYFYHCIFECSQTTSLITFSSFLAQRWVQVEY